MCYNKIMNYKILLIPFLSLFVIQNVYSKHLYSEKTYQTQWCKARGGQTEYVLNDKTRIDCLLPDIAVEFDFAPKWHECIGQALYYAKKTNKTPACVLILENGDKDLKYLYRLRYTVYKKKKILDFKTFTMKPENINLQCELPSP